MNTTTKKEKIKFSKAFWVANTVELFERAAYYGVFIVITLYASSDSTTYKRQPSPEHSPHSSTSSRLLPVHWPIRSDSAIPCYWPSLC